LVNKEASMAVLEMNEADMRTQVDELGEVGFVQAVRERLLGRNLSVNGRSIVDDQGAMILADGVTLVAGDAQLRATELRTQWGWS